MLQTAKGTLHELYRTTYGLPYLENTQLFFSLFENLQAYFDTGKINLTSEIDRFFNRLMERMFVLMNREFTFDDTYRRCLLVSMPRLQPFGSLPGKLRSQLHKSFSASRVLLEQLHTASNFVRDVARVSFFPPTTNQPPSWWLIVPADLGIHSVN